MRPDRWDVVLLLRVDSGVLVFFPDRLVVQVLASWLSSSHSVITPRSSACSSQDETHKQGTEPRLVPLPVFAPLCSKHIHGVSTCLVLEISGQDACTQKWGNWTRTPGLSLVDALSFPNFRDVHLITGLCDAAVLKSISHQMKEHVLRIFWQIEASIVGG